MGFHRLLAVLSTTGDLLKSGNFVIDIESQTRIAKFMGTFPNFGFIIFNILTCAYLAHEFICFDLCLRLYFGF